MTTPDGGVVIGSLLQVESQFAMYAVIATGGKQERVAEGQRLQVELLGAEDGSEVNLRPVLVVDGANVLSTPAQLSTASVTARVAGRPRNGC